MTRSVARIAAPVLVWALHFVAVYGLVSAACGPRGLLGPDTLRAVASLVTAVPAVLCVVLLLAAARGRRRWTDPAEANLNQAAWWAAAIAVLAILANAAPVALLETCSG